MKWLRKWKKGGKWAGPKRRLRSYREKDVIVGVSRIMEVGVNWFMKSVSFSLHPLFYYIIGHIGHMPYPPEAGEQPIYFGRAV